MRCDTCAVPILAVHSQAMDLEVGHVTFPRLSFFLVGQEKWWSLHFTGRDPGENSWINEDNVLCSVSNTKCSKDVA